MKLRHIIIIMIGLLHTCSALSQSLTTYYSSADKKSHLDLKASLKSIIANHKVLGYKSLWEYYPDCYYHLDNKRKVLDMYSPKERYYDGSGSAVSQMNKEHTVPKSWWGGGSGCNGYSDLYNVIPSDADANSRKSNYSVGEITKQSWTNGVTTIGSGTVNGKSATFFEPIDEYKGDFARIYFYMATCYPDAPWDKNNAVAMTNGSKETLQSWIIPMLRKWNKMDPVDAREIQRNADIYKIQGNRNPFIDYPQLAEYIWGDSISYDWNLATAIPNVLGGNTEIGEGADVDDPDTPGDDPDDEDDEPVTPPSDVEGNILFAEAFASISEGNSSENSGSSVRVSANDISTITGIQNCFKAGKAVRLGTGSATGSFTTSKISVVKGNTITVEIEVKGWTTVEGDLIVTLNEDKATKVVKYSATMSDKFEKVVVTFENIKTSNPTITFETSSKRCFINSVKVTKEEAEEPVVDAIEHISSTDNANYYNLSGQKVKKVTKPGLYITNNRKVLVR